MVVTEVTVEEAEEAPHHDYNQCGVSVERDHHTPQPIWTPIHDTESPALALIAPNGYHSSPLILWTYWAASEGIGQVVDGHPEVEQVVCIECFRNPPKSDLACDG